MAHWLFAKTNLPSPINPFDPRVACCMLQPANLVDFDINHPLFEFGREVLIMSCQLPEHLPD